MRRGLPVTRLRGMERFLDYTKFFNWIFATAKCFVECLRRNLLRCFEAARLIFQNLLTSKKRHNFEKIKLRLKA